MTMTDKQQAECADCGWVGPVEQLKPIERLYERVAPGEPMPAGECPNCWGALAHLVAQTTFEQFQASGRDGTDFPCPGVHARLYGDKDAPLYIEATADGTYREPPKGAWYLLLDRDEFISDDLPMLERKLYDFAVNTGYFGPRGWDKVDTSVNDDEVASLSIAVLKDFATSDLTAELRNRGLAGYGELNASDLARLTEAAEIFIREKGGEIVFAGGISDQPRLNALKRTLDKLWAISRNIDGKQTFELLLKE